MAYARYVSGFFAAISFVFCNPMVYAQSQSKNSIDKESKTYLICYFRDKVTGETSWAWGKDSNNKALEIEGEWTSSAMDAMLKINQTAEDLEPIYNQSCMNSNTNPNSIFAEYGVANSTLSFKHQIWFEKTNANPYNYPFSRIIAFGDSLSDNGNLYNFSHESVVTGSYYMGRFSNGPVWTEYVSQQLNLHLYDWAVSGATSDSELPVPYNMDTQVDNYLNMMKQVSNPDYENSLFTLLIGGNNYIFSIDADNNDIIKNLIMCLEKLIAVGGQNFIIPNVPDVSYTPFITSLGVAQQQKDHLRVHAHNLLLASEIERIKLKYPKIRILTPNTEEFLDDIINEAKNNPLQSKYNITNVTEKCDKALPVGHYNASTFCDNPKNFLFWDFVHPTTKVHCQMAQNIMSQLAISYGLPPFDADYSKCEISYVNKPI